MLNAQDHFDKRLRRLDRELRELRRCRYVYAPLKDPIQRGWCRFHVLASSAEKRADKDILAAILEVIGTVQCRKSPDFRERRDRRWRTRYVELEQPVRVLTAGEWNRRNLSEDWLRYFRREPRCASLPWLDGLVFTAPYVFELKIEPNWIAGTYVSDPVVEQRIAEIENWLWHHNAMPRLNRLQDGNGRWRDPTLRKLQARTAWRELRESVRDFPEVDPSTLTRRIRLSHRLILFIFPGVAQLAEALRSDRSQCGCNSCRRDHSFKVHF